MSANMSTILVVDDDLMLRGMLARTLTAEGYSELTAADGAEALGIAQRLMGQLPLVVTDIMMPKMDGIELAKHLLHLNPTPHILFVSGFTDVDVQLLPGPFLAKPFTPSDLAGRVRQILTV